eukprot:Gb_29890 [translate_table: standard]
MQSCKSDLELGSMINGKKFNRIRQIMKRWHSTLALTYRTESPTVGCSLSPRFKQRSFSSCDSDEQWSTSPSDVREGYLAVYVGKQRKRFIIPTTYLTLPVFRTLLEKAEEEFGFDHKGGLTIPCEVSIFKHVLRVLEKKDPVCQRLSLEELLRIN